MQIIGNIEFVSAWLIKGWAAEKTKKTYKQTSLTVCLDDKPLCKINDFFYRCDVKDAGHGDGVFGFEIDISQYAVHANGSKLSIKDKRGKKLANAHGLTDVETFALREAYSLEQPTMQALNLGQDRITDEDLLSAKKIAILVTYVKSGKIFSHHINQINQLKKSGYYVVVVHVTGDTSSCFQEARAGDTILRKANIGYDFGSWWYGARWLGRNFPSYHEKINSLIILNDSCFGAVPAHKIKEMELADNDIAGICDSYDHIYHLQSFFLMIRSDFLRSGEFVRWLNHYSFPENKEDVIRAGELGLGAKIDELNLHPFAIAPYNQLVERWCQNLEVKIDTEIQRFRSLGFRSSRVLEKVETGFLEFFERIQQGRHLNPTHAFWHEICECGVPMVKKELLLHNPANIPNYLSLSAEVFSQDIINRQDFAHYTESEYASIASVARHLPALVSLSPRAEASTPRSTQAVPISK